MIHETLQARVARLSAAVRAERPATESGFHGRDLDHVRAAAARRGLSVDELLAESARLDAAQVASDRRVDAAVAQALRMRHSR